MSGSLTDALTVAKDTLLASESFDARIVQKAGVPAVTHVHLDQVADSDGLATARPYALLRFAGRGSNPIAEGVEISLIVGGGILLLLEDNARETSTHESSYLDFLTWCGEVIDEMEDLSGKDDKLPFKSEMVFAPQRTPRNQRTGDNDYWTCVFLLSWGDQVM